MKIIILPALLLIAGAMTAQTKEIAFKSHSGDHSTFIAANEKGIFDAGSDFGVAPIKTVKNAELDSVIFISDSVAIMVTSEYCSFRDLARPNESSPENVWKAGSKIVYNHPLFSHKHSLDSIKTILKQQYHFRNPVDKVVFVGYDNGDKPEYFSLPLAGSHHDDNNQSPFGPQFIMILGLVIVLSLFAALITWKYFLRKEKRSADTAA